MINCVDQFLIIFKPRFGTEKIDILKGISFFHLSPEKWILTAQKINLSILHTDSYLWTAKKGKKIYKKNSYLSSSSIAI